MAVAGVAREPHSREQVSCNIPCPGPVTFGSLAAPVSSILYPAMAATRRPAYGGFNFARVRARMLA